MRLPSTIFQNHSQSCIVSNTPSDFQEKIDQISKVLSGCCWLLEKMGTLSWCLKGEQQVLHRPNMSEMDAKYVLSLSFSCIFFSETIHL